MVAFVEGLAHKVGFSEDAIVDIAISASEAVNNAILHGNKKNRKKKVSILVEMKKDRFIVRVTDQGTAFTPIEVTIETQKRYAMCLCKHTEKEPFCDGTHNRCGFASEESAV